MTNSLRNGWFHASEEAWSAVEQLRSFTHRQKKCVMQTKVTPATNPCDSASERARASPVSTEDVLAVETGASLVERSQQFQEKYKDWIEEQNRRFEELGLWNDEFRLW
jgi:hypothetical protein